MTRYVLPSGGGWDVYESRKCSECDADHPVKVNHIFGGTEDKMRDQGFQVLTYRELDALTQGCQGPEDDDEEEP